MRIAILDLGTNTFHLLIAEIGQGTIISKFKSKKAVKLGEGAIHKNRIAAVPFKRGIDTLLHYKKIIEKHDPEKVFAFATSAIRSAENGMDFVDAVKKKTGIEISVISGDKEAELICYGVRQCVDLKGKPSLIMDIGGGSTEFIIADRNEIFWKKSFDIGAARLLEIFKPSNPITDKEISQIIDYIEKQIAPLTKTLKKYKIHKLIGSSGSFDTFAAMAGYRFHKRNVIANTNSYKFNLDEFNHIHRQVLNSTLGDRMKMKGLIRMRVDMIVIAAICTEYILRKFEIKEMHLSKYALKEGALWKAREELYASGN
jgi:exopolyphosphatase/guanosine-5'-triphosphate,3'-diphosphate pyrophosphatase